MSLDLNTLLNDWPHETGAIKVRKIAGLDGREKLQLRIDLGVIQMEMQGRPDGLRPHNCESLLVYHQRRASRAEERGDSYELTSEQCNELQQEGIQYYHRYLSLFQINDFAGVIRDTQRNLDLFTFVTEHADRDELVWSFQQFRPYVLMMNTRAKASILLGEGKFAEAMREIERGRDAITEFFQQSPFPELATEKFRTGVPGGMAGGSQLEAAAFQNRDHAARNGDRHCQRTLRARRRVTRRHQAPAGQKGVVAGGSS